MTFPDTPLPVNVEWYIDGSWVSVPVRGQNAITITRGRQNEQGRVSPTSCGLTLNDITGTYNNRNPMSPYYGLIGRNTPMRVSVPGYSFLSTTTQSDYASTPDAAALDITGDLDIRVEAELEDWTDSGLAEKYLTTGNQRSWTWYINASDSIVFRWTTDGTLGTVTESSYTGALPMEDAERIALRVTLDVDDGAGGKTVTFYHAPTIDGPWTQLVANTTAGTTSVFASTAALEVGRALIGTAASDGRFFKFEFRNGINGSTVANPLFDQVVSTAAFTDSIGLTWTSVGGATLVPDSVRCVVEVPERIRGRDISDGDRYVRVQGSGVLRRLGQGTKPSLSPFRRRITSAQFAGLLAYWPGEDEVGSTSVASAVAGVSPMIADIPADDDIVFSADEFTGNFRGQGFGAETPVGTDELMNLAGGGKVTGNVPAGASSPVQWTVAFTAQTNALQAGSDITIARWFTPGGTYERWDLIQDSGGLGTELIAYTPDGSAFSLASTVNSELTLTEYRVAAFQNGAATQVELYIGNNQEDANNYASTTLTYVSKVIGNPFAQAVTGVSGFHLGHIQVWDTADSPTLGYSNKNQTTQTTDDHGETIYPWWGWLNETAADRLTRLCAESGVSFSLIGDASDTPRCGTQETDDLLGLLFDTAAVDGGILYESRHQLGLVYRTRTSMYNQGGLLLDFAQAHLSADPKPVEDENAIANIVEVTRVRGSAHTASIDSGPLSTLDPELGGIGPYFRRDTLNLATDQQLSGIASWQVHLGTVDEDRYTGLEVNLARAPFTDRVLSQDVVHTDIGDYMSVVNPPSDLPPDAIEQIVQGYSETITNDSGSRGWTWRFNTTPASPYTVGVVENAELGRADTAGSELAAQFVSGTDTSMSVTVTSGPLWINTAEHAAMFPFDVRVAGARVRIRSVGTILSTNPWLETDATGWDAAAGSTVARSTAQAHEGGASLLITPDGATATTGAIQSAAAVTTPADTYLLAGWLYSTAGLSDARMAVDWYRADGTTYISSGLPTAIAVPAGVWTHYAAVVTAPALAERALLRVRLGSTPTGLVYADELILSPTSTYTASPQTFVTQQSAVNGVVKTAAAGASISLWTPWRAAL